MSDKLTDRIRKGDRVRLRKGQTLKYSQHYGAGIADKAWTVKMVDKIGGRPRLYVEGEPGMIWASDAELPYGPNSPERKELLGIT